jgi:hypothetical protein
MLCGLGDGIDGTGWKVRGSNSSGDRPWVPLIFLYNGSAESFPGIKRPEHDLTTHTHLVEMKVRVELYLFPLCAFLACYGVTFYVRLLCFRILAKNKKTRCWSGLFLWILIFKNLFTTKQVMSTESRSSCCPL